jgi:hypothetical protein
MEEVMKKYSFAILYMLFFPSFLLSQTLIGEKFKYTAEQYGGRNDYRFEIRNVYTNFFQAFYIKNIIGNIYDIDANVPRAMPKRLGAADVFSENFQYLIARCLWADGNGDDQNWNDYNYQIAYMIAQFIVDHSGSLPDSNAKEQLIGKKFKYTPRQYGGRKDFNFEITNVYTKYFQVFYIENNIGSVFNINANVPRKGLKRLGTADVYSEEFINILARCIRSDGNGDDVEWVNYCNMLANMIVRYIRDRI